VCGCLYSFLIWLSWHSFDYAPLDGNPVCYITSRSLDLSRRLNPFFRIIFVTRTWRLALVSTSFLFPYRVLHLLLYVFDCSKFLVCGFEASSGRCLRVRSSILLFISYSVQSEKIFAASRAAWVLTCMPLLRLGRHFDRSSELPGSVPLIPSSRRLWSKLGWGVGAPMDLKKYVILHSDWNVWSANRRCALVLSIL